jgi:hypothetical protein
VSKNGRWIEKNVKIRPICILRLRIMPPKYQTVSVTYKCTQWGKNQSNNTRKTHLNAAQLLLHF